MRIEAPLGRTQGERRCLIAMNDLTMADAMHKLLEFLGMDEARHVGRIDELRTRDDWYRSCELVVLEAAYPDGNAFEFIERLARTQFEGGVLILGDSNALLNQAYRDLAVLRGLRVIDVLEPPFSIRRILSCPVNPEYQRRKWRSGVLGAAESSPVFEAVHALPEQTLEGFEVRLLQHRTEGRPFSASGPATYYLPLGTGRALEQAIAAGARMLNALNGQKRTLRLHIEPAMTLLARTQGAKHLLSIVESAHLESSEVVLTVPEVVENVSASRLDGIIRELAEAGFPVMLRAAKIEHSLAGRRHTLPAIGLRLDIETLVRNAKDDGPGFRCHVDTLADANDLHAAETAGANFGQGKALHGAMPEPWFLRWALHGHAIEVKGPATPVHQLHAGRNVESAALQASPASA